MDEAVEEDIKARTPKGWYGLATPKGWDELVAEVHDILKMYDPDYEVHQIKEKFGGLRYYCTIPHNSLIIGVIEKAEAESYKICQNCGAHHTWLRVSEDRDGERMAIYHPNVEVREVGPVATLCDACYELNKGATRMERVIGYT